MTKFSRVCEPASAGWAGVELLLWPYAPLPRQLASQSTDDFGLLARNLLDARMLTEKCHSIVAALCLLPAVGNPPRPPSANANAKCQCPCQRQRRSCTDIGAHCTRPGNLHTKASLHPIPLLPLAIEHWEAPLRRWNDIQRLHTHPFFAAQHPGRGLGNVFCKQRLEAYVTELVSKTPKSA